MHHQQGEIPRGEAPGTHDPRSSPTLGWLAAARYRFGTSGGKTRQPALRSYQWSADVGRERCGRLGSALTTKRANALYTLALQQGEATTLKQVRNWNQEMLEAESELATGVPQIPPTETKLGPVV